MCYAGRASEAGHGVCGQTNAASFGRFGRPARPTALVASCGHRLVHLSSSPHRSNDHYEHWVFRSSGRDC